MSGSSRSSEKQKKQAPGKAPIRRLGTHLALLALFAAALIAWSGSLSNGFVWDDEIILQRAAAPDAGKLVALLFEDPGASPLQSVGYFWRPAVVVTHILDIRLWGPSSAGMHATNLLLHLLVSLLVFLLARRALPEGLDSDMAALAGASLFAIHPLAAGSVAFISGRSDILASLFALCAILLYEGREMARPLRLAGMVACVCCAMLSKEWAMLLPLLLLVPVSIPDGSPGTQAGARALASSAAPFWLRLGLPFVPAVAILAIRAAVLGRPVSIPPPSVPVSTWLLTALAAVFGAVEMILWPGATTNYLGTFQPVTSPADLRFLAGLATSGALVALLVWAARRDPRGIGPALGAFGALVVLVTVFPPISRQASLYPLMERLLYFPLALLGIAIALPLLAIVRGLRARRGIFPVAGAAIPIVLFGLWCGLSRTRAAEWRTPVSLFESLTKSAPDSSLMHHNLGVAYEQDKRLDDAMREYTDAIRLAPDDYQSRNNLAVMLVNAGRYAEAEEQYRAALTADPQRAVVAYNLANLLVLEKRPLDALAGYREAILRNPRLIDAHLRAGEVLSSLGDVPGALTSYREAVRLAPERGDARARYGAALAASGNTQAGIAELEAGLRLAPLDGQVRSDLAVARLDEKNPEAALALLDDSLARFPDDARARFNRGNALRMLDRREEAAADYRLAIGLAASYDKAINMLGVTLFELDRPEEALAAFDRLLEIQPDSARALNNRGIVLQRLGRQAEARDAFRRALDLEPDFAEPARHIQEMKSGTGLSASGS